jgi:hypothetical protein
VQKGVACISCHGRVDAMPLMWRAETLHMQWCVECHRNPEPHIRPRELVFSMENWSKVSQSVETTKVAAAEWDLMKLHQIASETDCSVCHR